MRTDAEQRALIRELSKPYPKAKFPRRPKFRGACPACGWESDVPFEVCADCRAKGYEAPQLFEDNKEHQ